MSMDLFDTYARAFEARRETVMSVAEYLEGCRSDPLMYAGRARAPARRDRRAGDGRHLEGPAARAHLHEPHDPRLSGVRRILRHGRDDRADRRLLPPGRAGAGGAQADPLPARPRRRRKVLARRAHQGADGGAADLRAEGGRGYQPGLREPALPVRSGNDGAAAREGIRHPAPPPDRPDEPLVPEAARRVRRRHHENSRSPRSCPRACGRSGSPRPSRATRTTRTSPRWSARSTSASSRCTRRTIPTPTPIRAG